jgi:UDP-GlcNAc3NAcA epimerase
VKVLSVVSARPNYVKLAAMYDAFSNLFDHVVVDNGEHYDYEMNKIFYE